MEFGPFSRTPLALRFARCAWLDTLGALDVDARQYLFVHDLLFNRGGGDEILHARVLGLAKFVFDFVSGGRERRND